MLVVHHNGPLANELVTALQSAISIQVEPFDNSDSFDLVLDIIK